MAGSLWPGLSSLTYTGLSVYCRLQSIEKGLSLKTYSLLIDYSLSKRRAESSKVSLMYPRTRLHRSLALSLSMSNIKVFKLVPKYNI